MAANTSQGKAGNPNAAPRGGSNTGGSTQTQSSGQAKAASGNTNNTPGSQQANNPNRVGGSGKTGGTSGQSTTQQGRESTPHEGAQRGNRPMKGGQGTEEE